MYKASFLLELKLTYSLHYDERWLGWRIGDEYHKSIRPSLTMELYNIHLCAATC